MQTIDQAAVTLAELHYAIEPSIMQIYRMEKLPHGGDRQRDQVGLLEVNPDTIPSGIVPLYFGPSARAGVQYPSVIVEITPEELNRIHRKELELPAGWIVRDLIPRPQNGSHS